MPRPSLKPRKDGRYKCVYKGVQFYGDTQSEAYAKRDEYKRNLERGLRADASGVTVRQYAAKWMATYKSGVSPKVYNAYLTYLEDLLADNGNKAIKDVTTSDVQRAYNKRAGNSGSDIRKQVMTINSMFEAALADGLILRNPCIKAKKPEGTDGTHRALEPWERTIIEQMAHTDHRFAAAAMLMLYAGLRRGEAIALDIDRDVNFQAMTITIREAVRFEGNKPIVVDPKTDAGKRTIPMLDILADTLRGKHGLIVAAEGGGHLSEIAFKRVWESYLYQCSMLVNEGRRKRWIGKTKPDKEALKRGEKLPPWKEFSIRTHDLRHSYCTMLYEAGIDLKSAQRWMGHADEKMILQIYAHLTERQEQAAIEKLRAAMEKVQNEVQTGNLHDIS